MAERTVRTLLQMERSMQYGKTEAINALEQARAELKTRGKFSKGITSDGHVVLLASLMAKQLADACNQKGAQIPIDLHLTGEVRFVRHQRAQRLFHEPATLSTPDERVQSVYRIGSGFLTTLTDHVSLLRQSENRDATALNHYAQTIFKNIFSQNLNKDSIKIFKKNNIDLEPILPWSDELLSWDRFSTLELGGKWANPPRFAKKFHGTRWVYAKIDRQPGVNESHLEDLVKARIIHPAKKRLSIINKARRAKKLKLVTQEQLKDVYLIPVRWAGQPSLETERILGIHHRASGLWGRSDFVHHKGHFILAKGIGVPPASAKMQELPEFPKQFGSTQMLPSETYHYSLYHHKVGNDIAEQDFRGGMTRQSVDSTTSWLKLVRDEYQKAIQEKDPVALYAKKHGIVDLPIPDHIVSFKPFEAPVALDGTKRIRDTTFEQFGQHAEDWRVWFYKSPHPHRLYELSRPTYPVDIPAIMAPAGIELTKKGLTQGGEKITPDKATDVITRRHTLSLALLVHLVSHRLNASFGNDFGSVLTGSNPGPDHFPDWDTVEEKSDPKEWQTAYKDDLVDAKNTIRQTGKYMGLKLGADRFPISENLKLFRKLVRKGRMYAQRTGLLRST